MEASERGLLLRASERPLRATGSVEERDCGVPGGIDPGAGEIRLWGSGTAGRTVLLDAVLSAVHAGGEQRLGVGSLGTFSFLSREHTGDLRYRFLHERAAFGPPKGNKAVMSRPAADFEPANTMHPVDSVPHPRL